MRARTGRLFRKLLFALLLSMAFSMSMAVLIFRMTGFRPPVEHDHVMVLGWIPMVPLATSLLAVLLTGLALAWYLSQPLRALRWGLNRVAEGRFDTRVQPLMGRRRDEIADLARDLDRMTAQLQQLTETREALLHDISHELRSPLTRLQAAIGLLRQDRTRSDEMLLRIERESARIDALVEELLTLHRLEAGAADGSRERVDVVELLHAIAEDAGFEAHAQGRAVRVVAAPPQFVAEVSGELIYRAYENVIRNAVKYTAADTTVKIEARTVDDGATLVTTVSDRGPGVPREMLERIFEPFARVEGQTGTHGVGLGLAIARRALLAHGGRIAATPRAGGGLTMTIELPAGR